MMITRIVKKQSLRLSSPFPLTLIRSSIHLFGDERSLVLPNLSQKEGKMFFFGIGELLLAGWWAILFWPLLVGLLFFETFTLCKRAANREIAGFFWMAVFIGGTLHLFGFVDMVKFFREFGENWRMYLKAGTTYIAYFFAFGFGWMCGKGLVKAAHYRPVLREKLVEHMRLWDKSHPQAPADIRQAEIAAFIERNKINVADHKWTMLGWWLMWPFDLAWDLVFQWAERLEDVALAVQQLPVPHSNQVGVGQHRSNQSPKPKAAKLPIFNIMSPEF